VFLVARLEKKVTLVGGNCQTYLALCALNLPFVAAFQALPAFAAQKEWDRHRVG
jgi:hypothetical protein